jgi:enoyl-CoA hydratase/carnithine racemase
METNSTFSLTRWSDSLAAPVPAAQHVALVRDGAVAHIVLNRPERRNALDARMWTTVSQLVKSLAGDAEIKVVTLRGAGERAFSAGADIKEFEAVYGTPESAHAHNAIIREAQNALASLSQPTIAMVRGDCVGGGCGLALACDLRFASMDARFAISPARIGAAYGFLETRRLVAAVGPSRAKDLLFSGRTVNGEEALRIGLADRIATPEDLDAMAAHYVASLLKNSSRSIALMKSMVNAASNVNVMGETHIEEAYVKSFHSSHFREGYTAFIEKRAPDFR